MIKNIVFDIGNVLVEFGWKKFFENFKIPEEDLTKIYKATVGDPAWNEIDRGLISDEEVLEIFVQNDPSEEMWLRKIFTNINGMLIQYDYAKDWIGDLQSKGFKVYCLSNMSHKACRECAESMDFLPSLDGYVLSCEVNLCKPEPGIYQALFDKYNLVPGECVFIDDLPRNIEMAKNLGMNTILFKGKEEADAELAEILKHA